MGIDDLEFDSAKWGDVWSRVMPNSGETQKPDEAAKLREFMDAEAEAVRHVTAISERCCRHIGAALLSVAGCDLRHFETLHARYFILTGERYTPPKMCPVVSVASDSLRSVYIAKQRLTDEYKALGASNELYARLAEEEECTAKDIYKIITKLIN